MELLPFLDKHLFDKTTVLTDEELKEFGFFEEFKQKYSDIKYSGGEFSEKFDPKNYTKKTSPKDLGIKKQVTDSIYSLLDLAGKGSNIWVVHGNHTVTGKPLLANDPHVDNEIPNFWYQAELIYPDEKNEIQQISGVSVSGMPTVKLFINVKVKLMFLRQIMFGKTNYLTWGLTVYIGDTGDLFTETLDDTGKKQDYNLYKNK